MPARSILISSSIVLHLTYLWRKRWKKNSLKKKMSEINFWRWKCEWIRQGENLLLSSHKESLYHHYNLFKFLSLLFSVFFELFSWLCAFFASFYHAKYPILNFLIYFSRWESSVREKFACLKYFFNIKYINFYGISLKHSHNHHNNFDNMQIFRLLFFVSVNLTVECEMAT